MYRPGNDPVAIQTQIGLFLLGSSFAIWVVIMFIIMGLNYSSGQASNYYTSLFFGSIAITALGISLVNTGLKHSLAKGRLYVRFSSIAFIVLNLLGFYLIYFNGGGIVIHTFSGINGELEFLTIVALIFTWYVATYSFFITPFLDLFRKRLLRLSAVFSGAYILAITAFGMNQFLITPHAHYANFQPLSLFLSETVQIVSPAFAFPGFMILNDTGLIFNSWFYAIGAGMDAFLSYIILSAVLNMRKELKIPAMDRSAESKTSATKGS